MTLIARSWLEEKTWLVPGLVLTVLTASVAFALSPDWFNARFALDILPLWVACGGVMGAVVAFTSIAAARAASPFDQARAFITHQPGRIMVFALGLLLAGMNLIAFMALKPLLNQYVPFWAGPWFAEIDYRLFFNHDPWTLLTTLNNRPMGIFYHRGWFALILLALAIVLAARPGRDKSALLLTYFTLWSVAGPLIHALLPAAGPLFYGRLGQGPRFDGLVSVAETRQTADYLWAVYSNGYFGPGAGISAMPSMHCSTIVWMVLVFRRFAPRLFVPGLAAAALIFCLSIALGWHYAVDGLLGGAVTLGIAAGFRRLLRQRAPQSFGSPQLA